VPDFPATLPPGHEPDEGATGVAALRGDDAFIMQTDGKAWLYAPDGMLDGPLPTHYEPHESPLSNPFYAQQASPARQRLEHPGDPDNPGSTDPPPGPPDPFGPDAPPFPFAITTYRLAEHHTAGGMSRFGRRLNELSPEMFVEVDPTLARRRGLTHGGWATVLTARSAIEARVVVTRRMRPLRVGGGVVHQVGVPSHFGYRGRATGDAGNDLLPLALDPNVHISEFKAATCDIRPGRRPRGPALRRMVEDARGPGAPPEGDADEEGTR
jgi:formate dehydrogenase major subunit